MQGLPGWECSRHRSAVGATGRVGLPLRLTVGALHHVAKFWVVKEAGAGVLARRGSLGQAEWHKVGEWERIAPRRRRLWNMVLDYWRYYLTLRRDLGQLSGTAVALARCCRMVDASRCIVALDPNYRTTNQPGAEAGS